MADEKRVVRTAGVYGDFVLPGLGKDDDGNDTDLVVTPAGTEVTFEQWLTIADAAEVNAVVVRLDEDFPGELYAARAEKKGAEASAPATDGGENKPTTGTEVDGTDTSGTGSRQRRAANGG